MKCSQCPTKPRRLAVVTVDHAGFGPVPYCVGCYTARFGRSPYSPGAVSSSLAPLSVEHVESHGVFAVPTGHHSLTQ